MAYLQAPAHATRWIKLWLIVIGLMVYAMILVGGATRLTDSGLSITEWDPIRGALPPIGAEAWAELFDKYKQTAEYQIQNRGMSLGEFKYIFWWEWAHRLFGRLIGLVAVGGLVVFAVRKWLNGHLFRRLILLIALGGLQGFIGWWMVASGIGDTDRIDVAPYRLATHFSLALLILSLISWTWLDLSKSQPGKNAQSQSSPVRLIGVCLLALVALQMAAGALVAGLDAGRSYTDWPLMAGEFFPSGYIGDLGVRALFEGREATQFNHRILAYTLFAFSAFAAWTLKSTPQRRISQILFGLVIAQSIWGIITLVNAAMPLPLPLIHQGLGVLVLLAATRLCWETINVPSAVVVEA